MRPELAARAARQGGVVTRGDALECGYDEAEVRRLTRPDAEWHVVRRGAYVPADSWSGWTEDERYVALVRASLLHAAPDALASHQSAAALHGMPLRPRWRGEVHLTRPGVQGTRRQSGSTVHPASVPEQDDVLVDGFRTTSLARTALDVARGRGHEDGVIASDAALRLGATHADLDRILTSMWSWPGVKAARAAVADADGGSAGIGESLTRLVVAGLGFGVPETQYKITDGFRTAYADLRLGWHLFEFDGRVKYVGREHGGLASVSVEQVVWDEKQREDWLRSLGYGISRVVWADLYGAALQRTRVRLIREVEATLARTRSLRLGA